MTKVSQEYVLRRLSEGASLTLIARELKVSPSTLKRKVDLPKQGTLEWYRIKFPDAGVESVEEGKLILSEGRRVSPGELRQESSFISNKDRLLQRWARGDSISTIAKELKTSRTRLAPRLGIPPIGTVDYYSFLLSLLTSSIKVKELIPGDVVQLECRDVKRGVQFTAPAWWVVSRLRKDPDYTFFPSQDERKSKMIANGTISTISGMTLPAYAEQVGASYATVHKRLSLVGEENAIRSFDGYSTRESTLESMVSSWVEDVGCSFVRNNKLEGTSYLPDLVVHSRRLVIECDGLYWHSEAQKEKNYHRDKKLTYQNLGYKSIFLREDELLKSPDICRSIILNHLGSNRRVYARKTTVSSGGRDFISQNHLMGKGKGTTWSLISGDDIVAAMQVRWVSRDKGILDISRFCSSPGVTVVGGFSKLIKHVTEEMKPNSIQNFIDLRYGSGSYLRGMGWKSHRTYLSFRWTDCRGNTFHRMRYPGKTGYEHGLLKIWDCGQAKWTLDLS